MWVARLFACLLLAASYVGTAWPQAWPAKPVHVIVPFAAGGSTDQLTRFVATKLATALGQPVVVENVLGAGGSIGLERLARSAPDGYTLGTSANTLQAIAPHLGKLPYDTVKSFTPIGTLAGFAFALIVGPNTQIVSLADLIAKARQDPGKISAASAGVGTGIHMAAVLLSQSTGAPFNIVQYKGSGAALGDLIGGHVDFTFEVIGSAMPHISSGKTKIIATTGTRRHPLLPNVPLVAESIPGFEFVGWFALFGPAGLPTDVTRRLNDELGKIHRSEEFRNYLETRGYDILPGSAGDLAGQIQRELAKWGDVVKKIPEATLRQ